MTDVDIAIIGGGIVGATLASLLDQEGLTESYKVALIDAEKPQTSADLTHFDPRVVALSSASQSILERAKAWQTIKEKRACAYRHMYVWDADGTGNIQFSSEDIHQSYLGHIVENKLLVHALNQALSQSKTLIQLREKKLERIESGLSDHKLILSDGSSINAGLVVGADGARSKVRSLANFTTKEWDYGQNAIVTTVETELSHEFCAWQRFSPEGPLAFLPLSRSGEDSKTCSIVWSINKDMADNMMALSDDDFREALGKAIEHRLGNINKTDKRFSIPLRQCFARSYSKAGVVLVGDAAHSIHPLAGQGVNMGLYDISALVTELKRASLRKVPHREMATLRRYERTRQPHNLMAMTVMEMFKRGFGNDDILLRYIRNTGMSIANRQFPLKRSFAKLAAGV